MQVGWQFHRCPLETEPARFGPFAGLVEAWGERRDPALGLPSRDSLDMEHVGEWIGRIFIARIERDPFDLRFTLWGTELVEWWRVDYTGRTLGELSTAPALWEVERRYFESMDQEPFIGVSCGVLTQHSRSHIKVIGLDLPLSEGDGLSHVLCAHLQIGLRESIADRLPDCPVSPVGEASE